MEYEINCRNGLDYVEDVKSWNVTFTQRIHETTTLETDSNVLVDIIITIKKCRFREAVWRKWVCEQFKY